MSVLPDEWPPAFVVRVLFDLHPAQRPQSLQHHHEVACLCSQIQEEVDRKEERIEDRENDHQASGG